MIGRTNGGVGTGALLIKVVGGLTRPENPTYGTVWLETEVPINGWQIFSVSPTWEAPEGHVYLQDAPSTSGEIPNFTMIDPGKKPYGCIWERLIGAFQRINGAWLRLNGAVWRDGVWTPFFAATINVTYPAGATCTATDGVTTLTAPDTSGTWECVVTNAGTWTVSLDNGLFNPVIIQSSGENHTIDKWYLYMGDKEATSVTWGFSKISANITLEEAKNYKDIYVTSPGDRVSQGYFATNKSFDVAKFNTLYAIVSTTDCTYGYAGFGIMNTRKEALDAHYKINSNYNNQTINISITGITSCYFGGFVAGRYDYKCHLHVHSIWLE